MRACSQAATDICEANPECQGFQFCFLSPVSAGAATGRIRLKSALNISNAIYNPYCRSALASPLFFATMPLDPCLSTGSCCMGPVLPKSFPQYVISSA